jgi:hypothetical protein
MFEWFKKKSQSSRVFMCIKETKWTIGTHDYKKRAKILIIVFQLRNQLFKDTADAELPLSVLYEPTSYSEDVLMDFYDVLQNIRDNATLQRKQIKTGMAQMDMEFPKFAEEHAKDTNTALEVWMASIGASIFSDKKPEVREIWRLILDSYHFLDDAEDEIFITHKMTQEMGITDEIPEIDTPDSEDLKTLCPRHLA